MSTIRSAGTSGKQGIKTSFFFVITKKLASLSNLAFLNFTSSNFEISV